MDDTKRMPSRQLQAALVLLLGLSILLTYVDRGAVSLAAPKMNAELGIDPAEFGLIVSVFFMAYTPLQLAIGWACDRFSVYRLFSLGVAIWALATFATGFASGFGMLLALRVLLGLGESICFPGASKIIARHIPPERRGVSNAVVVAGLAFGPAVGTFFGGFILAEWGWRTIFWAFGAITVFWLLPWGAVVRRIQAEAPPIAEKPYPMLRLLRFRALWVVGLGHFSANFANYFILSWLPLFLTSGRGLSIATMTVMTTTTYLMQGVATIVAGHLSDMWTASGRDEGALRRTLCVVGASGAAIGIFSVAYAESTAALFGWLAFTGVTCGIVNSNIFSIAQIFAGPRLAGSWIGVQNTMSNLAGIIAPGVTGLMIKSAGGNYQSAFALAAGVCVVGALGWQFLLPKVQPVTVAAD